MHPHTVAEEALAAFHRARDLVKANPAPAHPPEPPKPAPPPPKATFKATITSVHPDWSTRNREGSSRRRCKRRVERHDVAGKSRRYGRRHRPHIRNRRRYRIGVKKSSVAARHWRHRRQRGPDRLRRFRFLCHPVVSAALAQEHRRYGGVGLLREAIAVDLTRPGPFFKSAHPKGRAVPSCPVIRLRSAEHRCGVRCAADGFKRAAG
jgi:hypothetical protein